jgi:predicted  nucleic acid-binding Zn-ribbon protein
MPDTDATTTEQIVKLARELERALARLRKARARLEELEQHVRTTRRMLNELTRPFSPEVGELPTTEPAR